MRTALLARPSPRLAQPPGRVTGAVPLARSLIWLCAALCLLAPAPAWARHHPHKQRPTRGLAPEDDPAQKGDAPAFAKATVALREPRDLAQLEGSEVRLELAVAGYKLSPAGAHAHLIVDNEPALEITAAGPLLLRGLRPGPHLLRAVLCRPWHEVVKAPRAFALVRFWLGPKLGGTAGKAAEYVAWPDPRKPLLTYVLPLGEPGKDAQPLELAAPGERAGAAPGTAGTALGTAGTAPGTAGNAGTAEAAAGPLDAGKGPENASGIEAGSPGSSGPGRADPGSVARADPGDAAPADSAPAAARDAGRASPESAAPSAPPPSESAAPSAPHPSERAAASAPHPPDRGAPSRRPAPSGPHLDFYLSNAKLARRGDKVRLVLDRRELPLVTRWEPVPLRLKGAGPHKLSIDLLDRRGRKVKNGLNRTDRALDR